MKDLILRTENGDFDLFGTEDIVETLGIFNVSDISSRSGDYSNEFSLPLTENNIRLIGNAQYINAINSSPFKRVSLEILISGLTYRNGFLEIVSVSDVIKSKFFTGNSVFINLIKNQNINDYDWSMYDHIWSVSNAVSAAGNTYGYTYSFINYGGQTTSLYLNIKKVLPQTFSKTILERIIGDNGYSWDYQFDTSEFEEDLIPFTNKNPSYPQFFLDLNSVIGSNTDPYSIHDLINFSYNKLSSVNDTILSFEVSQRVQLNVFSSGTGSYWDIAGKGFFANTPGTYSYSLYVGLTDYNPYFFTDVNSAHFQDVGFGNSPGILYHNTEIRIIKNTGGNEIIIDQQNQQSAGTYSGNVTLNQGDEFYALVIYYGQIVYKLVGGYDGSFNFDVTPEIKEDNTFSITLNNGLQFGGLISYAQILPKIKSSDFFKDTCIRYGLIFNADEDNKVISFRKFDDVEKNIPVSDDWSNKLDESKPIEIKYKYDNYCQNNIFKHKDDKSIVNIPEGSNYNLVINNSNLGLTKDLYVSPFAASELDYVVYDANNPSLFINIYDDDSQDFSKDVEPRRCFSRVINTTAYFTDQDGTGGSPTYLPSFRMCYFIDYNIDHSMGFGNDLIPRNSMTLVQLLQNLRIITGNFNLNTIDIQNIDFFKPTFIRQLDSYFFKSTLNQFNHTNKQLTNVELIKIN